MKEIKKLGCDNAHSRHTICICPESSSNNGSIPRSNINTCAATSLAVFLRLDKIFIASPKRSTASFIISDWLLCVNV